MKKAFAVLLLLAVAALCGWQAYRKATTQGDGHGRPRRAAAVAVELSRVETATIRDVGRLTGSLLPRCQFIVAPKVAGRLKKLLVNVGDGVEPNQLIATLDDEEYAQQVEQARAEREVARASVAECRSALEVGEREFERARALREKRIASESELDEAAARRAACEAKHNVALAQVKQKEAALKAAEVRLSYTRIRASWEDDGGRRIVGERFVDEGAMLKANDPIVSVLDIDVLKAVVHVTERDYPRVRVGQEVAVRTDAFPGRVFAGKIVRLAPLLKEASRQARVEVEVPNPDRSLKPGMFVRAQVEYERRRNATVVPLDALVRRDRRRGVFVADREQMKAYFVPVTVGVVEGESAEIVQPPEALTSRGAGWVVTLGQHLLEDGSAIILQDAAPTAGPRGHTDPKPAGTSGAQAGKATQKARENR